MQNQLPWADQRTFCELQAYVSREQNTIADALAKAASIQLNKLSVFF